MRQADEALAFAVGNRMTQMMCEMYENGGEIPLKIVLILWHSLSVAWAAGHRVK